ncbi:unnamed protein product, partial [Fusarium graminearum]
MGQEWMMTSQLGCLRPFHLQAAIQGLIVLSGIDFNSSLNGPTQPELACINSKLDKRQNWSFHQKPTNTYNPSSKYIGTLGLFVSFLFNYPPTMSLHHELTNP